MHLDAWLDANRTRLAADMAVISDTNFFQGNQPAITVGLRGIVYFQLDVFGSRIDLHSGGYGGTVDNPVNALCNIVAKLKSEDGRILVPGVYDDVVALSDLDRKSLADLPFDEEEYRNLIGVPALMGEPGYTTLERKGARPTLDVCGIWGGFEEKGPRASFRPMPTPRSACAWWRTRIPRKSLPTSPITSRRLPKGRSDTRSSASVPAVRA